MRTAARHFPAPAETGPASTAAAPRSDWGTLAKLLPYLWRYRWRVGIALSFLVAAKVANVSVPVLLKQLVDALSFKPGDPMALLVVPVSLIVAYGALRLSTTFFNSKGTPTLATWAPTKKLSAMPTRQRYCHR